MAQQIILQKAIDIYIAAENTVKTFIISEKSTLDINQTLQNRANKYVRQFIKQKTISHW